MLIYQLLFLLRFIILLKPLSYFLLVCDLYFIYFLKRFKDMISVNQLYHQSILQIRKNVTRGA